MDNLYIGPSSGLTAQTLVPNSSYLVNTTYTAPVTPVSSPTMGLMMLLSTFQYQTSYIDPMYSNAASQAGKAAYIQSGGQATQDKLTNVATEEGTDTAHSIGLTDMEMGIVGFTTKTIVKRQIDINGPKVCFVNTHLTATQNNASIGLKWNF